MACSGVVIIGGVELWLDSGCVLKEGNGQDLLKNWIYRV